MRLISSSSDTASILSAHKDAERSSAGLADAVGGVASGSAGSPNAGRRPRIASDRLEKKMLSTSAWSKSGGAARRSRSGEEPDCAQAIPQPAEKVSAPHPNSTHNGSLSTAKRWP